jgi:hypothetical protein
MELNSQNDNNYDVHEGAGTAQQLKHHFQSMRSRTMSSHTPKRGKSGKK